MGLAAGAVAAALLPHGVSARPAPEEAMFDLPGRIKSPVKIASVELLKTPQCRLVRTTSTDGATGLAVTNERIEDFWPVLLNRVAPFFVGKDARQIESLLDEVYTVGSNYKLAGLGFWVPVSFVEFSILDLLGRIAGQSVGQLLGGVVRPKVHVYMSSMRRDTTPQQEVDWLKKRYDQTGAKAIKIKIGGRMSNNADASPGRSEKLVALARRTFGDDCTIYVDANGSYDAAHAIEVGKMLQDHNVAFFEEPCPWEEYEETRKVTEALSIPVAGGEQDSSYWRLKEMIDRRVVDIIQPDVSYNGGIIRAIRIANLAARAGMPITPHSPKADPNEAYMLHFVSRTANAGPFQEYAAAGEPGKWYSPALEVKDGAIEVPTGPGLGISIDPSVLAGAQVIRRGGVL